MKTLIVVLIISTFLQTTVLSINLVLMILILRSLVRNDVASLYLAFFIGLLMSLLDFKPLGFYSLIYLVAILGSQLVTRLRFSNYLLIIFPVVITFLLGERLVLSWIDKESLQIWPQIAAEIFLILPTYILIRFWEERFIVRGDIKLRV